MLKVDPGMTEERKIQFIFQNMEPTLMQKVFPQMDQLNTNELFRRLQAHYYTILYYTILYYTILYYTILYSTILYYFVFLAHGTPIDWYNFCREVSEDIVINNSEKIGSVGITVEIDESKFGKRKYNRGKRVVGVWVFGGAERISGKCFLVAVSDRS
ncbi:Uncharacterized protein APZ42_030421 [Daphnia magna]|uniref:Uncharacterized protein n=1 Tax=Daphnia magna TaxID=35525 RepID=A0A164NTK2_9CRUS|nr:Uncharacterized protein APZ42_030421 [Daphnia magna]